MSNDQFISLERKRTNYDLLIAACELGGCYAIPIVAGIYNKAMTSGFQELFKPFNSPAIFRFAAVTLSCLPGMIIYTKIYQNDVHERFPNASGLDDLINLEGSRGLIRGTLQSAGL